MKDEDVMYVRLEGNEGILAKRYFLSAEMNLLRILKAIKNYHEVRLSELKSKTRLLNNIKEVGQNIKKIQMNIPKLTTSHSFVRENESRKVEIRERKEVIKPGQDRDLEMQLREIQDKLRALQR